MKLGSGYWPNVGYVTFPEDARTEYGTVEWKDVVGVYGSAEEAQAATSARIERVRDE
jgi:hypothetical protein